jgi:ubiquinone/menaquinone biosynthesis C-methylase UbiE
MRALLHFFFELLYHQLAFAYDLVAWVVSFGQWKNWILEVVPFIEGARTLELGPGPGHLQRFFLNRQLDSVAIDESMPMLRLARRNTDSKAKLARGLAQRLPFASESFDTIIATFPAEYFVDPLTLIEIRRCLSDGGRFIVLPAAFPSHGILKWLYKVTGESPTEGLELFKERIKKPFTQANFKTETHVLELVSGTLLVIVATK